MPEFWTFYGVTLAIILVIKFVHYTLTSIEHARDERIGLWRELRKTQDRLGKLDGKDTWSD